MQNRLVAFGIVLHALLVYVVRYSLTSPLHGIEPVTAASRAQRRD